MKLAIMQPYFCPYIGYFQLMKLVDKFVIYDNIQYTKKGWFNRNRILENGIDKMFTIPLKKDSDYLDVKERFLADDYKTRNEKTLRIIKNSYSKALQFKNVFPLLEEIFRYNDKNLFNFIYHSVQLLNEYLSIDTEIIISSTISVDHVNLRGQDEVLAIVKKLNADEYINTIGGINLYDKRIFEKNNIQLQFIKTKSIEYKQLRNNFIPWLSIIDVMMFNSVDQINKMLDNYELE